jgi:hypothetical protein
MDAKKAVLSRSLFRDFIGLSVVVDFVMVGSVTCMPAHRVFRHTWRDNTVDKVVWARASFEKRNDGIQNLWLGIWRPVG